MAPAVTSHGTGCNLPWLAVAIMPETWLGKGVHLHDDPVLCGRNPAALQG